jgi:hypothetical protein
MLPPNILTSSENQPRILEEYYHSIEQAMVWTIKPRDARRITAAEVKL